MPRVLMVGGPQDGKKVHLPWDFVRSGRPLDVSVWDESKMELLKVRKEIDPDAPDMVMTVEPVIKVVYYEPMRLAGDKDVFTVYRYQGLTVDQVLSKLIGKYGED